MLDISPDVIPPQPVRLADYRPPPFLIDMVDLVFELDPRAHWHDGHPVTARDVVWSIDRARDSTVNAQYALLLRQIASVTAEGDRRVVFRFRRDRDR